MKDIKDEVTGLSITIPSLETHFCYGYGCTRTYQEARAKVDVGVSYQEFLDTQISALRKFGENDVHPTADGKYLELNNGHILAVIQHRGYKFRGKVYPPRKTLGTVWHSVEPGDGTRPATIEDLTVYRALYHVAKMEIINKAARYWKRYGDSKLRVWAYDEHD